MANYDIKRTGRKCHSSGRSFEAGEEFASGLFESEEGLERRDFALDEWDQAEADCLGSWKSRMPETEGGRVYWAPNDVLLAYFNHLNETGEAPDAAYVMGLLLVRKRILQLLETDEEAEGGPVMVLRNRHTKDKIDVLVVEVTPERSHQIQQELAENLFTDRPSGSGNETPID